MAIGGTGERERVGSGIAEIDDILGGGFLRSQVFLVLGDAGTGKSTLGLQFLMEGVARGERVLLVALSESADELHLIAGSHGWSLDGVAIREFAASEEQLDPDQQYTLFHPADVELGHTLSAIVAAVGEVRPRRVVIDSLSELRLMAQDALRYRRQILALKRFLERQGSTALLLDEAGADSQTGSLQSIVGGVIRLEHLAPEQTSERRRLRVLKVRGSGFRGGYHDFRIARGGLEVFPRLIAAEHHAAFEQDRVTSGVEALDDLLGGGLMRGSSALLLGAAGTGKSTLASRYVMSAVERGERAAIFLFDESRRTALTRCANLGIDLDGHLEEGRLQVVQVDPAEMSPGEFAWRVREVAEAGARLVVVDSLNGYLNAMPEERFLNIQLHELLTYLGQQGVLSLLVAAQQGLVGEQLGSSVDASYLADAVVLLRYFELNGEVRRALSVLKKRTGAHERTIRELHVGPPDGITLGPPLHGLRGVLRGLPVPAAPPAGASPEGK